MRTKIWTLLIAAAICTTAYSAGPPRIKTVPKKFKLEGMKFTLQMEADADASAIHRWSIGPNPLGARIDRRTGLLTIDADSAAREFDETSPFTLRQLSVRCVDENSNKSSSKTVYLEIALNMRNYVKIPDEASAQRKKAIDANIRRLSLNSFLLGPPDDSGKVAKNFEMYGATLLGLAHSLKGRATEAWQAYPVANDGMLEREQNAINIENYLSEIEMILASDEDHPLRKVELWNYFTVDQSVEPTGDAEKQAKRKAIFDLLHDLEHEGVEIPFTGCVDRTMAKWLFNKCDGGCDDSDFMKDNDKGIGRLVEHHYYTMSKEAYPTRGWYVAIAKEAGVLKYWRERTTQPNYTKCGPVPAGLNPPLVNPTYDCELVDPDDTLDMATSHDSSKANDQCCEEIECHYSPGLLCTIFEGLCSLSSDPCEE